MNAHQIVEAVLFASDAPLTADEIARADERLDEDEVEQALQLLKAEYDDAERSFEVMEVAEGYQILTRPEFAPYLERFDNVPKSSHLSGPALETLAIIAYRQPIGRVEVEYIRGVGCAGVLRTLQDRLLVEVVGREEGLGRPLLYGTTRHFLEHFGFRSLEDLPRPEELPVVLRDRVPLDPDQEGALDPDQTKLALGEGDEEASESTAREDDDADDGLEDAGAGAEALGEPEEDAEPDDPAEEEPETPEEQAERAEAAVEALDAASTALDATARAVKEATMAEEEDGDAEEEDVPADPEASEGASDADAEAVGTSDANGGETEADDSAQPR